MASSPNRVPMDSRRKTALVAGVLYLLTFVSIPSLALYEAARDPNYIVSAGPDTAALTAGFLEVIVALAGIGTAVALYPVVKKQNQGVALAFVGARVLEAATIFVGIASILTIVTLRQAGVGPEALITGQTLVAQYDWAFTLGQGVLPAINALLLGTLMYKSGLVPRILPILGLIGAPLLIASKAATVLGIWETVSVMAVVTVIPLALWEFSLGVYLIVKGFRPAAVAKLDAAPAVVGAYPVSV